MPTDIEAIEALARRHEDRLTAAMTALQQRSHWSGFQESPSRKHHPEGAAEAGRARFESLLDTTVALGQTHREHILAPEVSPYTGRALGIHYERTTLDDALDQANDAQAAWQQLSPRHRVALCMEWLDRLAAENQRLRLSKERLVREVELQEDDPLSLERMAREKYWMIGPDEIIYRFEDGDVATDVVPGPTP